MIGLQLSSQDQSRSLQQKKYKIHQVLANLLKPQGWHTEAYGKLIPNVALNLIPNYNTYLEHFKHFSIFE